MCAGGFHNSAPCFQFCILIGTLLTNQKVCVIIWAALKLSPIYKKAHERSVYNEYCTSKLYGRLLRFVLINESRAMAGPIRENICLPYIVNVNEVGSMRTPNQSLLLQSLLQKGFDLSSSISSSIKWQSSNR